jgi:UPF0716 protein FxsA
MRLPLVILALLILMPLAELAVIIKVGSSIGVLPTIGLLVVMAILGTLLLRQQGLSVLRRSEEAMASGQVPIDSALDGVGLLVAGVLMMTPGFITDVFGLVLLVPWVRRRAAHWLLGRLTLSGLSRSHPFRTERRQQPGSRPAGKGGPVIDGEYTRIDEP